MWMHVLFFASLADKQAAERWLQDNVGYFEFDSCEGKEPLQLKFYLSVPTFELEYETIRQATKATEYLVEEL